MAYKILSAFVFCVFLSSTAGSGIQEPGYSFQFGGQLHTQMHPDWSDKDSGLAARCDVTKFADFPAIEWVLHFKNNGSADTPVLEDVHALNLTFKVEDTPVVHYARGGVCSMDDYQPLDRVMNPNATLKLAGGSGRSSSDWLPFFNFEQSNGTGLIIAVGWSGQWAAEFSRDKENTINIHAGMESTHLKLHPGEEIRTPRILVLQYEGGRMNGQNLLRRFLLAHHRPKNCDPMPVFNGNWGGTSAASHLDNIKAITGHDLPMEYYWIDAEWFGQGPWFKTAGDWRYKKDLYPDGFKPISDALHASGRKLLLWFEPERVCEGTPWYTEHANWLLNIPKEKRHYNWGNPQSEPDWVKWESARDQIKENDRLFNLANPEARKFLTEFMSDRITEFGLDCYRHDANISTLEFWRAADAAEDPSGNRQGITEAKWVQGLYDFWDGLLERHPNLIIDNCASGGRRIDLEAISRTLPLWISDYAGDVTGRQCHTYGISYWIPLNTGGGCVPMNTYDFRSTYSASVAFGMFGNGDAPQAKSVPDNFPFDDVKKTLTQYRSAQKYFLGDYYPLSEYSQALDAWMAWQFHRPDLQEGLVQVFRRQKSSCETGHITFRALDPQKNYRVTNFDGGEFTMSGKELMEQGIPVTLKERPSAAVFVYKAVE